MTRKLRNYSHLVEMDDNVGKLTIFRVFEDGTKDYILDVEFPKKTIDEDEDAFKKFALSLGENLLFDSPAGRRAFNL